MRRDPFDDISTIEGPRPDRRRSRWIVWRNSWVVSLILAIAGTMVFAGCASARQSRVRKESSGASAGSGVVVYIRGQAVEYGTGRAVANPPPRPKTLEEEVLDETRRKSDVTIWTAVAGPEGRTMWVPVKAPANAGR